MASTEVDPDARARVGAHLRMIGREMGVMSRSVARSIDLHHTQLLAVDQVLRSGSMSPGDLSRELGLSSGATTTLIDNLVQLGHLRREPHPTDGRRVVLVATDHARAEGGGAFRPLGLSLAAMLEGYTADELAVVDRFLGDLRHAVRDYTSAREAVGDSRRRSSRGADGP